MYYYCVHLFVLVGSDGDELSLFEGDVGNQTMTRADAHDVELRLILMERVQHDLRRERDAYTSYPSVPVIRVFVPVSTCLYYTAFIPVYTHVYLSGPVSVCVMVPVHTCLTCSTYSF